MEHMDPVGDKIQRVDWCDIAIFLEIVVIIGLLWCVFHELPNWRP